MLSSIQSLCMHARSEIVFYQVFMVVLCAG